jgi:hypothetical protein
MSLAVSSWEQGLVDLASLNALKVVDDVIQVVFVEFSDVLDEWLEDRSDLVLEFSDIAS